MVSSLPAVAKIFAPRCRASWTAAANATACAMDQHPFTRLQVGQVLMRVVDGEEDGGYRGPPLK